MRARIIIIICLIQVFKATSQESVRHQSEVWLGVLTETPIGKFSIWNDVHVIPGDFTIARTGLTYGISKKKWSPKLTIGYAHLWVHTEDPQIQFIHENRPWSQLALSRNFGRRSIMQRVRLEGRFKNIPDALDENQMTTTYNFRFRYLIQYKYFLHTNWVSETPYVAGSVETLVNFGTHIKDHVRIDQYRFLLATGIKFHNSAIQIGYLNRIKIGATTDSKIMYHTLMILYFQNIHLSKNHK